MPMFLQKNKKEMRRGSFTWMSLIRLVNLIIWLKNIDSKESEQ